MIPVPKPNNRFQHLLCDLDGTLIHSGGLRVQLEFIGRTLPKMKHHQGWKAAFLALTESQKLLNIPSKDFTNYERLVSSFQNRLKLSKEDAERELRKSMSEVFPTLKGHFREIENAAEFLDWAKHHFSLILATNPVWSLDLVHLRMGWGGIDPGFFKSITTADRMHACKPHPEYYQELLDQEKLNPSDCLLIGNERKMDLPATRVGIAVFLIRPHTKEFTCLEPPTDTFPGSWRGNYSHLKDFLKSSVTPVET